MVITTRSQCVEYEVIMIIAKNLLDSFHSIHFYSVLCNTVVECNGKDNGIGDRLSSLPFLNNDFQTTEEKYVYISCENEVTYTIPVHRRKLSFGFTRSLSLGR